MKYIFTFLIISSLFACTKQEDNTYPTQTIVTADSSDVTGRLLVEVTDLNGNSISGATASLFLTYDDVVRNISLYTLTANTSGRIDFGYILGGNYYVSGSNPTGTLHDTTVAQVLPKRSITRKLFLR
jgi:hypothetical protein